MTDIASRHAPSRNDTPPNGRPQGPEPHSDHETVFVVQDDSTARESLSRLLRSAGFGVEAFESGPHILKNCEPNRSGCLVLGLASPEDGLALQLELVRRNVSTPMILLVDDVDVTVRGVLRVLKNWAFHVLEKPFHSEMLVDCVHRALEADRWNRQQKSEISAGSMKLARLTAREREVMDLMVTGKSSIIIGYSLGLNRKVVESLQRRIVQKMREPTGVQ